MAMEEVAIEPPHATCDERLRARVNSGGPDAVEAAVALMERHDPDSLEGALELVPSGADPSTHCQKALAEAWDRYFHMRSMSWD